MQHLRNAVARVAPIPSPVLIAGESGSGKELVARDLHQLSGRQREPFVAVNNIFGRKYVGSVNLNGTFGRILEPAPGRAAYMGMEVSWARR